jgi:hypothetical protein
MVKSVYYLYCNITEVQNGTKILSHQSVNYVYKFNRQKWNNFLRDH